jgi:hypothetical protein
VHQGEDVGPALWDPLVDELTWHSAQQILNSPGRARLKDTSVKHLLSGIAVCGVCDSALRVGHPRGHVTYLCGQNFCVAMVKSRLDAYVQVQLLTWLAKPAAAEAFDSRPVHDALAEILAQEAALMAELEAARGAAMAGNLSVASLIAVESGLMPRVETLRAAAARMGLPPAVSDLVGRPDLAERWTGLELGQQRAVLRSVAEIRLNRNPYTGGRGVILPGRITVRLGMGRPA